MPIEILDVDGGVGAVVHPWGTVTGQEYVAAIRDHIAQNDFSLFRFSLADLTDVTQLEFPSEFIHRLGELCRAAATQNPDAIIATVAPTDIAFGLARMYEITMAVTSWETMTFRTRAPAEEWVRGRLSARFDLHNITFQPTGN